MTHGEIGLEFRLIEILAFAEPAEAVEILDLIAFQALFPRSDQRGGAERTLVSCP